MVKEGVPCVGYGDIYMKYDNYHFNKAQSYVDEYTASDSQPANKGTLFFTGTGETADEIGKCVCYTGEETIYVGGDIITFKPTGINPLFLTYQQYQPFSLKNKASFGQGHSVVHIQKDNLEKLSVAYPEDHDEQERIVQILMKWDKAITIQNKIIEKLRIKRKALLQILFNSKNVLNTKIRIGDFIQQRFEKNKNNITNIKSVSNLKGFIDQRSQFSKIVASDDISNYKVVRKNDIAYNPSRINVGSIAVYEDDAPGIISPMYVVFSCNNISPKLLLLLLESERGRYEIKSFLSGSVRNTLAFSDLCEIKLPHPSLNDSKILKSFELIDSDIKINEKYFKVLKQQRKTLQQYLINGIVRI